MTYRENIDMEKLNQREKDLINLIDRKIANWLDDSKNWRMSSSKEVYDFLMWELDNKKKKENNFIFNNKMVWVTV
jgi:hypothetical protein